MRLATFNVLHGRAPSDGRVDLPRLRSAVAALDADVLALQEVDRAQPRSGGADLTALAAEAGGYAETRFAPALTGLHGSWGPAQEGLRRRRRRRRRSPTISRSRRTVGRASPGRARRAARSALEILADAASAGGDHAAALAAAEAAVSAQPLR